MEAMVLRDRPPTTIPLALSAQAPHLKHGLQVSPSIASCKARRPPTWQMLISQKVPSWEGFCPPHCGAVPRGPSSPDSTRQAWPHPSKTVFLKVTRIRFALSSTPLPPSSMSFCGAPSSVGHLAGYWQPCLGSPSPRPLHTAEYVCGCTRGPPRLHSLSGALNPTQVLCWLGNTCRSLRPESVIRPAPMRTAIPCNRLDSFPSPIATPLCHLHLSKGHRPFGHSDKSPGAWLLPSLRRCTRSPKGIRNLATSYPPRCHPAPGCQQLPRGHCRSPVSLQSTRHRSWSSPLGPNPRGLGLGSTALSCVRPHALSHCHQPPTAATCWARWFWAWLSLACPSSGSCHCPQSPYSHTTVPDTCYHLTHD